MSNHNFEEEKEAIYEDELDRMRAQRKKRQERRKGRIPEESDISPEPEMEEDFQIEYLEEAEEEENYPSAYRSPLERAADRYMSEGEENDMDRRRKRTSPKTGHTARYAEHVCHGNQVTPKKAKRRKRRKGWKLFLLILLLIAGFLFFSRWRKDRDGYWNIAVFGVDSRDSNLGKGALADVQMIASINKKTGEIRLVSVYRDTYVQINDDGDFHKINEAYFKGGYQQALSALKRNLDVEVDDYATFNWKAVADAINILGGIDLEITESEFRYINSFITETVESTGVYSTHLQSAGMNHLDGVQAVAYSRLRLMDTDFNRTERQRKVVSLALEKAKQADLATLKTVVGTVIPEISTSIGIEDVIPLAKNVSRYHLGQTGGFPFAKTTAKVGKMDCVIPMTLESNVILLHQFLFDEENYVPSSSVKTISAKISEKTGIYEEGKAAAPDGNLAGTSGSGNSSGSSSSSGGAAAQAVQQEAQPIVLPEEPQVEMTDETPSDETIEEASEEESSAEDRSEQDTQEEPSVPAVVEPMKPDESTLSSEQIQEGPGAVNPTSEAPNVMHIKPTEPTTEEFGPGFE